MEKKSKQHLKRKLKYLIEGLKLPFGFFLESIGELIIIVTSVFFATIIFDIKTNQQFKATLWIMLVFVFIAVGLRFNGRNIIDSMYKKKK